MILDLIVTSFNTDAGRSSNACIHIGEFFLRRSFQDHLYRPETLLHFQTAAIMKSLSIIVLSFLALAQASVLSTTNVATVLAGVAAPSTLTISAAAIAAIAKLGTGGVNAASLTAADTAAISACTAAGRADNTASKANLSDGTGSAGAIAL